MCANCGFPAAPGHWSEAGAATPHDRLRARFRRARALRTLLAPYGLTAHDDGVVRGITVLDRTGRHEFVAEVADIWAAAERMAGRRIDPLDPAFIGEDGEDAAR